MNHIPITLVIVRSGFFKMLVCDCEFYTFAQEHLLRSTATFQQVNAQRLLSCFVDAVTLRVSESRLSIIGESDLSLFPDR